jgi:hypothetical protein
LLRRNLSADKLHIYRWPTDEPHADLHVLQEQICDYLSLKSFKRKYPGKYFSNLFSVGNSSFFLDIYRRIVDLHEREYLKSQNVVTETQCDLGLTALKLDEVLELISTDYPEVKSSRKTIRFIIDFILLAIQSDMATKTSCITCNK